MLNDSNLGRPAGNATLRKARRGPADHLREALLALTGGHAIVADHSERAWASITFEGSRHTVTLLFEGAEAGEHFIAALPDHEFAIPTQLVADATIISADHAILPEERLSIGCEILLLRDA